ncbi:putative major facilitator superfamily [Medicago truncatula]|nr:putative major facilitator superfamily [Medicago truncatula]
MWCPGFEPRPLHKLCIILCSFLILFILLFLCFISFVTPIIFFASKVISVIQNQHTILTTRYQCHSHRKTRQLPQRTPSMSSAIIFGGATATKPPTLPKNHRTILSNFHSPKLNLTRSPFPNKIQFPNGGSTSLRSLLRLRVSSNDAQFNSLPENNHQHQQQQLQPSFTEFITSERVKVVAMLALALALCNADRVVMSVAIVPLSVANGWTRAFSGIVQSSFLWGYLLSPIGGGMLVDNYGGKVVMAWGVALWSLATFLTPFAAETSLLALLAVRALLGLAEGVALPCMNNMVARWFPQTERARAVGISMAGFQLGCAIGLTLSPILMSQGGIFGPFVIFGLSGFLWVLVWLSATSSTPDRSPQISKYELEYILNKRQTSFPVEAKKVNVVPPFRRLLSKMPTWSLIAANAMHSWGFFVVLSWMPIYFNSVYHVDLRQAAWFSAVPWVVMAIMNYLAGFWSDMMIQSGTSVTLTRKIMQSIGFVGPGVSLIGLATARNPSVASAWLTLAFGLKSFGHSGFLVNFQEIAPQYSGVIHGMANTAGTLAAIIGTVGAGFFVELVGSFRGFLLLTSVLYFLAALFYCLYSTGERVNFDDPVG